VSKKEKLLARLTSKPSDFTWSEACTLMQSCGYQQRTARGGGSGRMFINVDTKHKVRLHEPHPRKTLLAYMVAELIDALRVAGEIK
jgi:hypothetical protein